jgi:hypothetical protein
MITGYDLINGYYEDEKLYSTGDDELDDLLEKAFCEGYEYAQREFSEEEEKKDLIQAIKEAEDSGDKKLAKKLRNKYLRKDTAIGAGIGTGIAGIDMARGSRSWKGLTNYGTTMLNDAGLSEKAARKTTKGIIAGTHVAGGLIGTGAGALIGRAVGKGKLRRRLNKLKEEEKENNKEK